MRQILHDIGRGLYRLFIAVLIVSMIGGVAAFANYTMTQGVGTTFGSIAVSAVHYAQQLICDPTTPSQCWGINSSGQGTVVVANASTDPCVNTKTNKTISINAGNGQLVAASGSTQVYICSAVLFASPTTNVNFIGGTGAACTTANEEALVGSTTAISGMSIAAQGGLTYGSGIATVIRTITAGNGVCILQSGSSQISGNITYIQQ